LEKGLVYLTDNDKVIILDIVSKKPFASQPSTLKVIIFRTGITNFDEKRLDGNVESVTLDLLNYLESSGTDTSGKDYLLAFLNIIIDRKYNYITDFGDIQKIDSIIKSVLETENSAIIGKSDKSHTSTVTVQTGKTSTVTVQTGQSIQTSEPIARRGKNIYIILNEQMEKLGALKENVTYWQRLSKVVNQEILLLISSSYVTNLQYFKDEWTNVMIDLSEDYNQTWQKVKTRNDQLIVYFENLISYINELKTTENVQVIMDSIRNEIKTISEIVNTDILGGVNKTD
jgi:hypothetical protein